MTRRPTDTGVLMRVTVVLLSPQGTGLDVGETGDIAPPLGLQSHLDEFGVLLPTHQLEFIGNQIPNRTYLNHGLNNT